LTRFLALCVCATRFWCSTNTLSHSLAATPSSVAVRTLRAAPACLVRALQESPRRGRACRTRCAYRCCVLRAGQTRPGAHHVTAPGVWKRRPRRSSRMFPRPYSASFVTPYHHAGNVRASHWCFCAPRAAALSGKRNMLDSHLLDEDGHYPDTLGMASSKGLRPVRCSLRASAGRNAAINRPGIYIVLHVAAVDRPAQLLNIGAEVTGRGRCIATLHGWTLRASTPAEGYRRTSRAQQVIDAESRSGAPACQSS